MPDTMFSRFFDTHGVILPMLVPFVGAILALAVRRPIVQRSIVIGALLVLIAIAARFVFLTDGDALPLYRLGDWPVPIAIVFVVDRFASALLLLTAVVGLGSALYATGGLDREAPFFHPLFLLQVAGLNGAFLAGDLFNLFVFFELLLIASYGLLIYGSTMPRLRSGVHYVVLNLVGSAMFLIAIGTLYGATGTLNMADMAARIATLPASDAGLVRAGGLLLLVVFGLKAALMPLGFWLPEAYSATSVPVASLFALMTKVGIYAIVRVGTLFFGAQGGVGAGVYDAWLLPAAIATMAVGSLAAWSAASPRRLTASLLLVSIGTMVAGLALPGTPAMAGALYYLMHSTLAAAAMFLLAEESFRVRRRPPALVTVWLFITVLALAGLPPLPGFIGKALILMAALDQPNTGWVWTLILASSAVAVTALGRVITVARAGHRIAADQPQEISPWRVQHAPAVMLGAILLLTLFAGPATAFAERTAQQLRTPDQYIRAVLDAPGGR
jgi:multicomponent K+:H+ antiporter subunit D